MGQTNPDGDHRRHIPHTSAVLADTRLASAVPVLGQATVKAVVAETQERARRGEIPVDAVADVAAASLPAHATTLRPVINATGVVLHTNLGRAPLSAAAVDALQVAAGHTDVEYDVHTGGRNRRGGGALDALAHAVPAAEASHVVNNGAAALVLAATALAAGRKIIVSRGELVEIGDGFRLPDLLESTGASLLEVGTTNRTAVGDYRAAIGPDAGFILKVHPSNFVMNGFTSSVPIADLADLGVPVVADIGSGMLAPDPLLSREPDAGTALNDGATLVTASGDKLLGGPQAGLIFGGADVVDRLRRHPLARALRAGKLVLAALEATLRGPQPPTWQALRRDPAVLRVRAEDLSAGLVEDGVPAELVQTASVVGGGGAPGLELPSWAIALPARLAKPLRTGKPCVVGRVERDRLLLDLRCVPPELDGAVRSAVRSAASVTAGRSGD